MRAAATCAAASLAADEPLAATATEATDWLLVEVRGAWGRDGVADTPMPSAAAAVLASFPGRTLLVRRPDRRGRGAAGITVVRATVADGGGSARRHVLASLDELDGLSLEGGEPVDGDVLLVCAHGRRDACCARLGVPLFDALDDHLPGPRLWQASHLGGHRFAPNLVALPSGVQLGRVPLERAGEVARMLEHGRIPLDLYRGRTLHPRSVQAAEILVRSVTGCDGVAEVTLVSRDGDLVTFATPAGVLTARVAERPGPPLSISCGAEAEPTSTWVASLESGG